MPLKGCFVLSCLVLSCLVLSCLRLCLDVSFLFCISLFVSISVRFRFVHLLFFSSVRSVAILAQVTDPSAEIFYHNVVRVDDIANLVGHGVQPG